MSTNRMMHCLALSMTASMAVGQCSSFPSSMDSSVAAVDNTGFADCHGQLKLGGTNNVQIVDESGELVQLMGISSHGLHWFPSCYTKDSIQYLVENWGINLFRAAMYVTEGGYSDGDASVKDLVKEIVAWTKDLGIYVIIDWHMLSPGDPNDSEYSEAPAFWAEMAQLYKDETHVIYEICNEPNDVEWSTIKSYADTIIPIIRQYDDDALIVVGTTVWSQGVHEVGSNPVADPYNVMYTFHFYSGTHMSLYSRVETYAASVPIFATEWGTSEASGDGGPYLDDAKTFLDLFIEKNIPFSMWSYADKDEVSAALEENACSSSSWDSVSCAGLFLRTYIRSKARTCSSFPSIPVTTPSTTTTTTTTTPTPSTSSSSSGTCALYSRCDQDTTCCVSGSSCMAKDQWYSQCRTNCPSSWNCKTVTTTPTPPVSTPASTPTPPSTVSTGCPSNDIGCGCSWTNNGAYCGKDDGSECWCKCCCEHTNSCSWSTSAASAPASAPVSAPVATPTPPSTVSTGCPSNDIGCGCSWTNNGAYCGKDDGSECWCKCCCEHTNSCSWSSS